jgi:hypothetical protein
MMTAALIKERLSLRDVAAMCGTDLPRDGVKFRSPLRPDRNPSCTIKGEVMRDWSRNQSYDAISFYAAAKGISNAEALSSLADKLSLGKNGHHKERREESRPEFNACEPSEADLLSIIQTRQLPPEGVFGLLLAYSLGILQFAHIAGHRCWLLCDEARRCVEARRLDGIMFPAIGHLDARKAHTLRGSTKSWPIGIKLPLSEARSRRLAVLPLVLVEGGPDLLAAYGLLASLPMDASDVQPVAMLGTGAAINEDALPHMAGRRVIILSHGDVAGEQAAGRWGQQLSQNGCTISLRRLPHGKDLNDLVSTHGLGVAKDLLL